MQSSSDHLRKKHDYDNYLYKHHSTNALSNCDISLCTETIEVSETNPLARKTTYCHPTTLFNEPKSQGQYLNHEKTCVDLFDENGNKIVQAPVSVKFNSYHRYNLDVKSKEIYKTACLVELNTISFTIQNTSRMNFFGDGTLANPYNGNNANDFFHSTTANIEYVASERGYLYITLASQVHPSDIPTIYINDSPLIITSGTINDHEITSGNIIKIEYVKDNQNHTPPDKINYSFFALNRLPTTQERLELPI